MIEWKFRVIKIYVSKGEISRMKNRNNDRDRVRSTNNRVNGKMTNPT